MWAQLIQMQLKPGENTAELIQLIRSAEQPGSGLVRSIFIRNQADPRPGRRDLVGHAGR